MHKCQKTISTRLAQISVTVRSDFQLKSILNISATQQQGRSITEAIILK
jgi:hypothetical protein